MSKCHIVGNHMSRLIKSFCSTAHTSLVRDNPKAGGSSFVSSGRGHWRLCLCYLLRLDDIASLVMSTSVLEALPGKLDIKGHSPSILYLDDLLNADDPYFAQILKGE